MKSNHKLHAVLVSLLVIVLCLSVVPVITMAAQETRTDNSEIGFTNTKQDNPADEEDGDIRVPIGSLPSTSPTEPSASVHQHTWQSFDAVDPTCDFEGNIAYKVCTTCGDAQNAQGETIAEGEWVLAPLGHTWVDHAAVAPTCDTDGNIAYQQCSACGAAQTAGENPIPLGRFGWVDFATGHKYVNGTCSVCGGTDPDYVPAHIAGDINGDTQVNNEDVVLLLWHTLFPEDYPLSAEIKADLTGNGKIDNEDVVLLLWHTLFPEDYPLN